MRRISYLAAIIAEIGQRARIFISNTMTGNRLVCIVACDRRTVLATLCHERSSSFSNIKHDMDEVERELDVVKKYRLLHGW